jgi:hypothetical protein
MRHEADGAALTLGMLGASPYFDEDASHILFFAAW